jgi:hypothetical protein
MHEEFVGQEGLASIGPACSHCTYYQEGLAQHSHQQHVHSKTKGLCKQRPACGAHLLKEDIAHKFAHRDWLAMSLRAGADLLYQNITCDTSIEWLEEGVGCRMQAVAEGALKACCSIDEGC